MALRHRKLFALLLGVGLLGGCASGLAPSAFDGGSPALRPEVFFAGNTQSSGVMQARDGTPTRRLRVTGRGRIEADGALHLDQTVTFDQDPPQLRSWVLRRFDAHRYSATLTDAAGPVEAEVYGDVMHLSYAMKAPFGGRMEQWMYLQPDGRTLVNEATVSFFGIVVARLSERITHED